MALAVLERTLQDGYWLAFIAFLRRGGTEDTDNELPLI